MYEEDRNNLSEVCEIADWSEEQIHNLRSFSFRKRSIGDLSPLDAFEIVDNNVSESTTGHGMCIVQTYSIPRLRMNDSSAATVQIVRHLPSKTLMARKTIPLELKRSSVESVLERMNRLERLVSPHVVGLYGSNYW